MASPRRIGRRGGSGAPASIHARIMSSSAAEIGLTENSDRPKSVGISSSRILRTSRLFAEFPAIRAGPVLPPLRIEAAVRRSSPPSCFLRPWQTTQLNSIMSPTLRARADAANAEAEDSGAADSVRAPASTHALIRLTSSPSSLASFPGGIVFSDTSRTSKLSLALPGTIAGSPLSPPSRIPAIERRSSPAFLVPSPWHFWQWFRKIGAMSRSNAGVLAFAGVSGEALEAGGSPVPAPNVDSYDEKQHHHESDKAESVYRGAGPLKSFGAGH